MNTNDDGCRLCFRSKWQLSVCHMRKIYLKKENSIASNILSSHTRTHMLCNPQACSIVLFINAKHVKCLPARSEEPLDRIDVAARDTSTVQMVKIKISLQTFFFNDNFLSFSFELHVFLPRCEISSFLRITEAQTSSACFSNLSSI